MAVALIKYASKKNASTAVPVLTFLTQRTLANLILVLAKTMTFVVETSAITNTV